MKKINFYLGLLLLVGACATSFVAQPLSAAVPNTSEQGVQNNLLPDGPSSDRPEITRRQASDLARQRFSGRVLSIRRDRNNWRVRMDSDGTVFNVFVNSNSGVVSRPSNE